MEYETNRVILDTQNLIDSLEEQANKQESEGMTRTERLAIIGRIHQERAYLRSLQSATIGEYHSYGSYVWVDTSDGEALAQSLEDAGIPVTRVRSQSEQSPKNRTNKP